MIIRIAPKRGFFVALKAYLCETERTDALKFQTTVENAAKACYNITVINFSGE